MPIIIHKGKMIELEECEIDDEIIGLKEELQDLAEERTKLQRKVEDIEAQESYIISKIRQLKEVKNAQV
jgi:hypothetical protein